MAALSYPEALAWLYRATRGGRPRDPARMLRLMAALGLKAPPQSVHVVGTSGKGTVAAMLAAALAADGYRVGRFLSPHVEDFTERIAVNDQLVPAEVVTALVSRLQQAPLPEAAFFELTLALALAHFSDNAIDMAVIEAGVGARHDATIVLEPVVCTIITTIGYDHREVLGPTLRAIAADKAAAIRPGVPVVTGATGEGLEVIRAVAKAKRSPLYVLAPGDPLFALPALPAGSDAIREQNQRLAAAAGRLLGLSEEALRAGLSVPPLPGRRETFLIGERTVLLDGAHNPSAALALRATLTAPYVLLFGALPRKDGEATVGVLEPDALATFITMVDHQPSALSRLPSRTFIADPLEALQAALGRCPPEALVLVTGSLYLAGQLRPWLRGRLPACRPASSSPERSPP